MSRIIESEKLLVTFLVIVAIGVQGGRYGGRSRGGFGGSRHSYSKPSYSHPSPASLSYPAWHPAPSSRPAAPATHHTSGATANTATNRHPIGFEHLNSQPAGSGGGQQKPIGFQHVGQSSSANNNNAKPIGFEQSARNPVGPPASTSSQQHSNKPSAPPAETNHAGSGHASAGTPPPYGFKTPGAAVGPPTNSKPLGNLPPGAPHTVYPPPYSPHNPGVPPPAYNPAYNNPAGYGPPPAYNPAGYGHPPAYNPAGTGYGYGGAAYPQQHYGGYPGQYHQPATNININNINTNSYGGGGYGGFGGGGVGSYPSYHYATSALGGGAVGLFLGYSLAKLTTPTFNYAPNPYNGYAPRYDHYEVHHYYHNKDAVPAQSTIQPDAIVGCRGDSGSICPGGTTSLCTSNGAILCVASATSTVPCDNGASTSCVKTVIPCINGTGDCQLGQNTTVTIPCISKAQVPGNITYINNTIIVNQTTIYNNGTGTTVNGTGTTNGTDTSVNSTTLANGTAILNGTSDGRSKRDAPTVVPMMNDFCVTILALPAERKPTEQEEMVEKGTGVFAKFLVRVLGVN